MVELRVQDRILDLAKHYGSEKLAPQKQPQTQDAQEKEQLKEELSKMVEQRNDEMKKLNTSVSFRYDDTIEGLLVTVKDEDGEKVIRELPSKEAIELMKKMRDLVGSIFDEIG